MLPHADELARVGRVAERARPTRASHAATHIGLREDNQDTVLADDDARLYVVADGLGGKPGGATASRLAVETIARVVCDDRSGSARDGSVRLCADLRGVPASSLLEHAVRSAHRAVRRGHGGTFKEMATTIAALHFAENLAVIAHVGDSRVYRLRAGVLELLTEDHSLVNDLLRHGTVLSVEQRQSHAHVVMRALGVLRGAEPDLRCVAVTSGDVYLVCSDGLHGALRDARIGELLGSGDSEVAADRLISAALDAGGNDNISAVVVRLA